MEALWSQFENVMGPDDDGGENGGKEQEANKSSPQGKDDNTYDQDADNDDVSGERR